MSVVVTANINQKAVFFAGETFHCTISFTNPLPPTSASKTSSQDSDSSKPRLQNSEQLFPDDRHHDQYARSSSSGHAKTINESKAGKKPHKSMQENGNLLSVIVENPAAQTNMAGDLNDSGIFGFRNFVKRSASFTGLASLLTGGGDASEEWDETEIVAEPASHADASSEKGHSETSAPKATQNSIPVSPPMIYETDTETDDDLGFIDLQAADGSDTFSIDLETGESSPRSSVDYLSVTSPEWSTNGSLMDYKRQSRRPSIITRCSSSPSLTQKYETLLWGFAQIVGVFVVDGSLMKAYEFEPLKLKNMYGPGGGMGGAVGGGMLGIFTPTAMGMSTLADMQERADNKSIPVFSTPPSILFIDVHLAPGETRTYSYETRLPADLPPTHKGKAIKFQYNLIIGTHRGGMNHQSHIVHLPFRVFNYVSEDGARPMYDLMNPVIISKDEAIVTCLDDNPKENKPAIKKGTNKAEFIEYVDQLVRSLANDSTSNGDVEDNARSESDSFVHVERELKSCTNTVAILSKNMRKATYDICKNNARVAQLCLLKTTYQLGDVVTGVINFNDALIQSYQVSITLESNEQIEASIAARPQHHINKITRKVHGEHHEFCLYTRRISFAIPIPTNGTPDFTTTAVKLHWGLRLEFITGDKNTSPLLSLNTDERHLYLQAVPDVSVETFDCLVPIKVYPTSYESARTFPHSHTFYVS
ncbi:9696_t:CDS:10 [Paraglomus brasilianum]|uniref:9696_t:CDS:1 n=1 Tax=Paraglomus brasilianum TaxID=144538 RepID=A0A9N9F7V1_9GLOM|nr:9696_t:CDS:10 [Paraglomus brasilianum]